MLHKRLMKEKQAWNSLGKKTAADIALSLKYNDLKHKEIQTSQSKQNSPARQFFNYFIELQEILTDSCLSFQYAAWALRGPQGSPGPVAATSGPPGTDTLVCLELPSVGERGPSATSQPGPGVTLQASSVSRQQEIQFSVREDGQSNFFPHLKSGGKISTV